MIWRWYYNVAPSVLWCCWLGLLTCKTHYRVGELTAAWQFVDIHQHWSFDNGWQYVSSGQWQPPLSGAPVHKWLSTITRERGIPPDSESGGIPHLFWTSLSTHIGNAWRARHDNNNNNNNKPCDRRTSFPMDKCRRESTRDSLYWMGIWRDKLMILLYLWNRIWAFCWH